MQIVAAMTAEREHTFALIRRNFRHAMMVLAIVAIGFAALLALDVYRMGWMTHGRTVARIARESQRTIAERQDAFRGYLLSHEPRYRARFDRWTLSTTRELDSLVLLTGDNPAQHRRATRYRDAVSAWSQEATVALAHTAENATLTRETALLDRARDAGAAFLDAEERLYGERVDRERETFGLTSALLCGLFASLFAGLQVMRHRTLAQAAILVARRDELQVNNAALYHQQTLLAQQNEELRDRGEQVQDQAARLEEQEAELEATVDELRTSEELFRAVVNSMTDVVFTLDLEQRYTHVFGGGIQGTVDPTRSVIGRRAEEIVDDAQAQLLRAANETALRGESAIYEWELSAGDERRHYTSSVSPLRDASQQIIGVLGITRDISAQRANETILAATQEKYRHAQKLEAVGQLAGGVAHDFNNLLTVILGFSELLLAEVDPDEGDRAALAEIKYAAERGASLVRQLLAFSRQQALHPQLLDLTDVVRRTERMLARTIDASITLRLRLSTEEVPVLADVGQLELVLMTLAVNARDAMPAGGSLTVSTANRYVDGTDVRTNADISAGWYAELTVQDDGVGMSTETLARLFEPFFTTKPVGKGTGLGLSTVHGIVQQSGGRVFAASEVGHGSTFRILFPRADTSGMAGPPISDGGTGFATESETRGVAVVAAAGSDAGVATILLVDDDDAIRNSVARLLLSAGHTIIPASSAVEALRLLERDSRSVDLVLSDMVMPTMSGRELAYEIRVRFPHAAVVLMSGYTKDSLLADDALGADTLFLEKPFSTEQLNRTIAAALASARQRARNDAGRDRDRSDADGRRALDIIVNGVDAVVWESSVETGAFHYVSRRAESLVGYPLARWPEHGFFESILHADDRDRVLAKRHDRARDGTSFSDEYRIHHANGDVIWVRDLVQVVADADGLAGPLRGVMIDVTDRMRAEQQLGEAVRTLERERTFLAVVLENLSEAVVACDEHAVLTLFNAATRDLHGLPREAIGADEWAEHYNLYHADGVTPMQQEDIPLFRALNDERINNVEMVVAPKNGRRHVLLASGRRFADGAGHVLGAVVAMRDITEIKHAERELIAAKEVAELANRTKSHFLSLISHELRTPLTAVIGFANVLRKNRLGHLALDDLQYVDRIAANGRVLLQLVNDLLELTQIETAPQQAKLTPVDLAAVVEEVTQTFMTRAAAKSLTLRWGADAGVGLVPSDPVRLRSVLSKLLDNAIKFTPSGSVRVHLRASEEAGSGPRIAVVDTGSGIAPEQLEAIFAPFQQGEDFSSRLHGGSGLGLPLARQQCRAMNCRLSVSSEQGIGTSFAIAFDA